jgi:rRNA-processing protein FCF1
MTLEDIIGRLSTFREEQLLRINSEVVAELKALRRRESQRKRFLFQSGDRVTWTGRKGTFEGIVERVKQKKALVKVGVVTWDVPLNMLNAA